VLRRRKLRLETQLLIQQLRPRIWCLEVAKVVVGAITIFSLIGTFLLGLKQIDEARQSRDDQRFDQAVARLSGSTATERLAGVAGLGLYLEPQQKAWHRATLRFLMNALALEQDPTVRGELLDSVSNLRPPSISQDDLNDALQTLRDRNRALYARQRGLYADKIIHGTAHLTDPGDDETGVGQASDEDLAPLRATATAITALVRNGARSKDLSNIYCVRCDFTGKTWEMTNPNFPTVADFAHATDTLDLSGTDFEGAILKGSNFIGVDLHGASFDSADLLNVNFAGADLAGAKFTDYGHHDYAAASMEATGHAYPPSFPDFTCADLSGADFTGSVFFGIYGDHANDFAHPILYRANLAGAKLGKMWVFTVAQVPPNYSPTPFEQVSSFLFEGYSQVGSYTNLKARSGQPVIVSEFWGLPGLNIKEPVPPDYWLSTLLVFSELASVRNLDQSELPQGLKDFISRNQKAFSSPNHPTPCTPKH
jgi:uncharacterized protein YjbI with pentapeptide repeats